MSNDLLEVSLISQTRRRRFNFSRSAERVLFSKKFLTLEMTWRQTAADKIMKNENDNQEGRCLPLTSINLLDAALPKLPPQMRRENRQSRFCAGHIQFESPFPKDSPSKISVWKYTDGAFAIDLEVFTKTAFPHKQIKTFCCGKNKTEVIYNFAQLLFYNFEIEAIDYKGKRGFENDLIYVKLPNPKLYVPFAAQERILDLLESI